MPTTNELIDRLSRTQELNITFTGRKSGRAISKLIWFVFEGGTLYLLPVYGSATQWYKNVVENPKMKIEARGAGTEVRAVPITDKKEVDAVIEKFRQKYGAGDVKKYYSGFDVAVLCRLS